MKYQYEILLLLDWGFRPREIIAMGYNKKTVYKWNRTYKEALQIALQVAGADQVRVIKNLKSAWKRLLKKRQE